MKKIKTYIILILAVMFVPLFLGCGEKTFENTPWVASGVSVKEAENNLDKAKEHLIEVGLSVKFTTETTYNLFSRLDGSGENKTVKDVTSTVLYFEATEPISAEVTKERFVNNEKVSQVAQVYNNKEGKLYTKRHNVTMDSTNYKVTTYTQNDEKTFPNILSEVVSIVNKNALTSVSQKTFENVNYYRLNASSSGASSGLDVLRDNFSENANLYDEPNLYEVFDKKHDYVLDFYVEYGVDNIDYLNYFAFGYSVKNSNDTRPGERGEYLTVSSVTKLNEYGQNVQKPSDVEDKNYYIAYTFVDEVKQEGTYVQYREETSATSYDSITVYKVQDGLFVNLISYSGETQTAANNYYFKKTETGYQTYEIDIDKNEYWVVEIDSLASKLDYSKPFYTKNGEDEYLFGNGSDYINLKIKDGEVYSVKHNQSTEWLIQDYDEGLGTFANVKMENYTLVEKGN